MAGLFIICFLYILSIFAEFVAPSDPTKQNRRAVYHLPQMIHFWDRTEEGISIRPYVYEMDRKRDPKSLRISYVKSGDKIFLNCLEKAQNISFGAYGTLTFIYLRQRIQMTISIFLAQIV